MSKKTKDKPQATAATDLSKLPVRLDRIALRAATYEEKEISSPPLPVALGQSVAMAVDVQGGVGTRGEFLELQLRLTIEPDSRYIPVKVAVTYSAFFVRPPTMADDTAVDFLHGAGVRILFPYIRETVSNLTSRGVFGPVWLDPMDIQIIQAKKQKASSDPDPRPNER